jgi:hypothetical protein
MKLKWLRLRPGLTGHDLLIPEPQSQPQYFNHYSCNLITPATAKTIIMTAIRYLLLLMVLLLPTTF